MLSARNGIRNEETRGMRKVEDWLRGGPKSPRERLLKEWLKGLLA
jgi:hypothetical protein